MIYRDDMAKIGTPAPGGHTFVAADWNAWIAIVPAGAAARRILAISGCADDPFNASIVALRLVVGGAFYYLGSFVVVAGAGYNGSNQADALGGGAFASLPQDDVFNPYLEIPAAGVLEAQIQGGAVGPGFAVDVVALAYLLG